MFYLFVDHGPDLGTEDIKILKTNLEIDSSF
jgi:hypothetical protein